ncbi:MAG TPA: SDR family NAD(P)-dependent oxidoreductase, partial [Pirellulales bacterium]
LLASSREDQVAFRGDKRFVARLRRATVEQTALSLPTGAYRIEFAQSDAGASIAARPVVRRRPGRGEVEVEVRAVAVTARDRNRLLGLDESAKAKLEFAGVVVAVGPGVTAPLVGSPVVGLASGTFGSHVVASANQVSAKPPVQSFVEAVSRATSIRTLPVSQIATALDALADPKAGRVVLTVGEDAKLLRSDRSYLLTGGLGGLGLRLAEWLAENGAGPLVLLGRSAPAGETLAVIEKLRGLGARIETRRCDASNREQLAAVFAEFGGKLPPLGGVFHLAGVLDDGLLRDQSRERFDAVMGAKVQGAWHLDDLSRNQPVEHFVLFSSAASLLGSPGQGNYASANAFLDSLAASRRMEGLPGLAVNWGNWSEVGMAAAIAGREGARWAATGVGWVRPTLGLAALGEWMTADRAQVGLVPIDWATFFERVPVGAEPMWLAELTTRRAATDAPPAAAELKAKIADVPSGERFAVVLRHVVERCAKLLKNPAGDLPDPQRAVYELGFDSLLGVEFCNLLALDVGRPVSPVVLFEHPTLESLARYLTDELALAESEAAGTSAGAETSGSGASADGAALDDTPAGATADELRLRAVKAVEEMSE